MITNDGRYYKPIIILMISLMFLATFAVAMGQAADGLLHEKDNEDASNRPKSTLSPTTMKAKVVASFVVPGGEAVGLAWGDHSLWLADANQKLFRLDQTGKVLATVPLTRTATGLTWDGASLWTGSYTARGTMSAFQIDETTGQITKQLNGAWPTYDNTIGGLEWVDGYLYVTDVNAGDIHKFDATGRHLLSWSPTFFESPKGMTYDGSALWLTHGCMFNTDFIHRYSPTGELQEKVQLDSLETCDYSSDRVIAWDGDYLWYAGKFTIYKLDVTGITGPFVDSGIHTLTGLQYSAGAWGDYDNDSDLDMLLTGRLGSEAISKIYRNEGNGNFIDSQITVVGVYQGSADWGDYDHDGDLDILLTGCIGDTCSSRITRIYQN